MLAGAFLLAGALALAGFCACEEWRAEAEAEVLLAQLPELTMFSGETPAYDDMPTVLVDGREAIGTLSLPALNRTLPVFASLDSTALQQAPCRYAGSLGTDNLAIAGHSYRSHFGGLQRLSPGDEAIFIDALGIEHRFALRDISVVDPEDVAAVTESGSPLTLFTCTWGGTQRYVARFDRI